MLNHAPFLLENEETKLKPNSTQIQCKNSRKQEKKSICARRAQHGSKAEKAK